MKLCTFDSQCLPSFLLQADIDQSARHNTSLQKQVTDLQKACNTLQAQLESSRLSVQHRDDSLKAKTDESEFFRTKAMQLEQKVHNMQVRDLQTHVMPTRSSSIHHSCSRTISVRGHLYRTGIRMKCSSAY